MTAKKVTGVCSAAAILLSCIWLWPGPIEFDPNVPLDHIRFRPSEVDRSKLVDFQLTYEGKELLDGVHTLSIDAPESVIGSIELFPKFIPEPPFLDQLSITLRPAEGLRVKNWRVKDTKPRCWDVFVVDDGTPTTKFDLRTPQGPRLRRFEPGRYQADVFLEIMDLEYQTGSVDLLGTAIFDLE